MLLSAPRVYVCYASCDNPIHHPIIRLMYTHRISGVAHGVKRYCYLFLDRLLQARLGLEDAPILFRLSPWGLPAHFDVFRDAVFSSENTGGMGAGPRRPALWLSLSLPGWVT
jgi:hypothetical protein